MSTFEPIAVVGRACVLPGALDPEALWRRVAAGEDLTSDAPEGRWGMSLARALTDDPQRSVDRAWSRRGGYVSGFEAVFDPAGLEPEVGWLARHDPLLSWTLHAAREALKPVVAAPRARTDVILGNLSFPTRGLSRLAESVWLDGAPDRVRRLLELDRAAPMDRFMSGLPALLTARALGLGGFATCLDAACASSLYAIRLAADRLADGVADLALAGAVNRSDDLFIHVGFCALQALSKTGQSRPFHPGADGLVPAEGAVVFALKRLRDAERDGDRILGVIRGVGLSNDGRAGGILAPDAGGQERAMRAAWQMAGLDPASVQLVECHATGTPVGDKVEIASMRRVFGGATPVIGSVKSNLGHAITAAGGSALLKVLGAMEAGVAPPTRSLPDTIPVLEGTPFRALRVAEPWPAVDGVRRAAVSAFGFGGNNAHLVVESYAAARPVPSVARRALARVAVTALSVRAPGVGDASDLARVVLGGESRVTRDGAGAQAALQEVGVGFAGLRFPPNDLAEALPQQLAVLDAARDAAASAPLPAGRTGVFIGMGADAEVCRYGARWRMAEVAAAEGWSEAELSAARDAVVRALSSAGVVGTMPNIPANRLQVQLDLSGPGFTVSAEELSGTAALELGWRAVARGDLDAALVGAVDLAAEPVHRAAAAAAGLREPPGDAAVVLVLRRLEDAVAAGIPALAVLDLGADPSAPLELRVDAGSVAAAGVGVSVALAPQLGHAHAASGLMHVAGAIAASRFRALPGRGGAALPRAAAGATPVRVVARSVFGGGSAWTVRPAAPPVGWVERPLPPVMRFAGADRAALISRLAAARPGGDGPYRLLLWADDPEQLATRAGAALARLRAGGIPADEGARFGAGEPGGMLWAIGREGGAHPGAGRSLLLALPDLWPDAALGGAIDGRAPRTVQEQDDAAATLSHLHLGLLIDVLGARPDALWVRPGGEAAASRLLGPGSATGLWVRRGESWTRASEDGPRVAAAAAEAGVRCFVLAGLTGGLAAKVESALGLRPHRVVTLEQPGADALHAAFVGAVTLAADGHAVDLERLAARLAAPPRVDAGRRLVFPAHPPALGWSRIEAARAGRPEGPAQGVDPVNGVGRAATAASVPGASAPSVSGAVPRTLAVPGPGAASGAMAAAGAAPRSAPRADTAGGIAPTPVPSGAAGGTAGVMARAAPSVETKRAREEAATAGPRGEAWTERDGRGEGQMGERTVEAVTVLPRAPWIPPVTEVAAAVDGATLLGGGAAPRIVRLPGDPLFEASAVAGGGGTAGDRAPPATSGAVTLAQPAQASAGRAAPRADVERAPAVDLGSPATPVQRLPRPSQEAGVGAAADPGSAAAAGARVASVDPGAAPGLFGAASQLAVVHAQILREQAEVHEQFLASRRRAAAWMAQQPRTGAALVADGPARPPQGRAPALPPVAPGPTPPPVALTATAPAATPSPRPAAAPTPSPAVAPAAPARVSGAPSAPQAPPVALPAATSTPPAPLVAAPPAVTAAGTTGGRGQAPISPRLTCAAAELPGLKLDRAGLEVHASGPISTIFGDLFERQDGYHRQVRMPEPPLLLADRVVGVEAEPGVLARGVVWTETDIGSSAWYLHQGRMPAGVMIEAGQADLLLISWMGIDFLNQSDRVYRLLGCTLTYHDVLPEVGDTLRYEIHVDGHAKHGDVRLFFFHYDCVSQGGRPRLSVRGGQAGFFTDAELADSAGVLWDAETGEHAADARVDPPAVIGTRTAFNGAQIEAFADGDALACFGPGFELARTHSDTPRIAPPPMLFFKTVTHLDPKGGPWGRGYLRAEWPVAPDDWFFQGHFKNDPCMPGTLMFEGCLQALAFYLTGQGYTLRRDGWRFEPVTGEPIEMRCRGQVRPEARELIYEVFVEEVHSGPIPMVFADLLCTVDGRKAFHARRCGLRLAPGWPLDHMGRALLDGYQDIEPVASADGFRFDYRSMLACAWGRPSEAFGPMYKAFDGPRAVPRLPGPPYHFLTRVTELEGPIGGMKVGSKVQVAYDIPPDAWYFDENGAETMPFAVLLEAALQPCGWLASYIGSATTVEEDLFFRNLDGTGTLHVELPRRIGTMLTDVTLNQLSRSAGMIIVGFDVRCHAEGTTIYTLKTVFGFFPGEALSNQKGLPIGEHERLGLEAKSDFHVDLTTSPAKYCDGSLRLAAPMLRMIDRVTGFWPDGGKAGLGRLRSEKDVRSSEWFFQAHFYQDPVQPGSLGIEAMIQLLQFWMIENDLGAGMAVPRFEPLALGVPMTWKYRGQVVPRNRCIACDVEIVSVERRPGEVIARATASLWVDGLRIYEAKDLGMRIVDGAPPDTTGSRGGRAGYFRAREAVAVPGALAPGAGRWVQPPLTRAASEPGVFRFDPAKDGWIGDHRPTWTVPALPMTVLLDRLAAALRDAHPDRTLRGLEDVELLRWARAPGLIVLRATIQSGWEGDVATLALDGEGPVARARALWDETPAPTAWASTGGDVVPDVYRSGRLFHGPAFQLVTELVRSAGAARATLDAGADTIPGLVLAPGLLDAALHAIPHDDLTAWDPGVPADHAAYPWRVTRVRWLRPAPRTGAVYAEVRYRGLVAPLRAAVGVQLLDDTGVLLELELIEALLPKGPIGSALPADRRRFLEAREAVPGLGLSRADGAQTTLDPAEIQRSDWLPGTVAEVYGLAPGEGARAVLVRDHAARALGVHPSALRVDGDVAIAPGLPLSPVRVQVRTEGLRMVATGATALDLAPVEAWWRGWFGLSGWPVEDLYYSVIERFVDRVVIEDPAALTALRGRPLLLLGNHQTAIESLLLSILVSALHDLPTVTIAKAEHRGTWLGRLIQHAWTWPGVRDPRVITYFERENKEELAKIIGALGAEMAAGERSVMVHVEGTRAHSCREPVVKMSGAFLDMAMAVGAPVVPVRFVGGLPVDPLLERTEFPVGMGRQQVWLGQPILPAELARLPYKERKARVIDGIHRLGPPVTEEVPLPGDPALMAAVAARQAAWGVDAEHATLFEVLQSSARRSPATAALLAGAASGELRVGDHAEGRWLAELGRRLFGAAGPRVVV